MKTFYKYLIFFILGIILSLTLKKKKLIEGWGVDQTIPELFRGGRRRKNYITTDNDGIGYYKFQMNNCDPSIGERAPLEISDDIQNNDDGTINYEIYEYDINSSVEEKISVCENKCSNDDNCIGFQHYDVNSFRDRDQSCKYFKFSDNHAQTILGEDGSSSNIKFSGLNSDNICHEHIRELNTFFKKNNNNINDLLGLINLQPNEKFQDTSLYLTQHYETMNNRYDPYSRSPTLNPYPFITQCPSNQIASVDKTRCECDGNSILNEIDNCVPCPENSTPNEDYTNCICNEDNDFMNDENTCMPCPQNSISNTPYKTNCICPNNTFFNGTECVELSERINLLEKINNSDSLNRGCANYTCSTNPNTYDNYQKKIPTEDDELYRNCSNFLESKYIHANPDIIPCSHEICCDNNICNYHKDSIECDTNRFLPNKSFTLSSDQPRINAICCPSMNDLGNRYSQLYNDILQNSMKNNEKITGNDIRNYIYNTFFDFRRMLSNEDFRSNIGTPEELGVIVDPREPTNYEITNIFYEIFSRKLSTLEDSKLQYLLLKSDVVAYLNSNELNLENINLDKYNINGGDNSIIKIKKLLINLDKILIDNNINYKQLDRFFHDTLNQNKDKHLNLGIFIGLLNQ